MAPGSRPGPAKADFIAGPSCWRSMPTTSMRSPSRLRRARRAAQGDGRRSSRDGRRQSERGVAALAKAAPEARLARRRTFVRTKEQMSAVFNGALGFAACRPRTTTRRRRYYLDRWRPARQLVDALPARSVAARGHGALEHRAGSPRAPSTSRAPQERHRQRHRPLRALALSPLSRQRGGWNELLARVVAGEKAPPGGFVKSIRSTPTGRARHTARRGQRPGRAELP